MPNDFYQSLSVILSQSLSQVVQFLPKIIAALLILAIGAAVARFIKGLTVKILETLKVSSMLANTPVEHFLRNAEITEKIEGIIGSIVYWLVMLVVIQSSVSVLGLASLSEILAGVLGFVPQVLSATVVLVFGVLMAGVVESLVKGSIKSIDGKSARLLGKVASYLVVTVTLLAAVSELGIASEFIVILFVGLVSTVSLGLGLAIGLGGKDVVSTILNRWYQQTRRELSE